MASLGGFFRLCAVLTAAALGIYAAAILICPAPASAGINGGLLPAADCLLVVF